MVSIYHLAKSLYDDLQRLFSFYTSASSVKSKYFEYDLRLTATLPEESSEKLIKIFRESILRNSTFNKDSILLREDGALCFQDFNIFPEDTMELCNHFMIKKLVKNNALGTVNVLERNQLLFISLNANSPIYVDLTDQLYTKEVYDPMSTITSDSKILSEYANVKHNTVDVNYFKFNSAGELISFPLKVSQQGHFYQLMHYVVLSYISYLSATSTVYLRFTSVEGAVLSVVTRTNNLVSDQFRVFQSISDEPITVIPQKSDPKHKDFYRLIEYIAICMFEYDEYSLLPPDLIFTELNAVEQMRYLADYEQMFGPIDDLYKKLPQ